MRATTSDRWRRIILRQQRSGLSIAGYCRRHEVPPASFFAWKRRLGQDAARTSPPTFVPVVPTPAEPPAPEATPGAIELCLDRGRRLLLRPGFDPATLRQALAILEGRP